MELDFEKMNGLIPAIIQDNYTQKVLMLGFMNKEAYEKTMETGKVTFFSRTKNRLWTKGEESGNFLHVVSVKADCDNDTLLIMVHPEGPVCHKGTDTCWGDKNEQDIMFLKELQDFIDRRRQEMPEKSYTTSLFNSGVNKMAQKVGEEAVETILEACNGTDERLIYEGADLLYHLIVLLTGRTTTHFLPARKRKLARTGDSFGCKPGTPKGRICLSHRESGQRKVYSPENHLR